MTHVFHSVVRFDNPRNPYEIHKILWGCFPYDSKARRPFLFRMLSSFDAREATALMQSVTIPNANDSAKCDLSFLAGEKLIFSLHANPTKRLSKERKRIFLESKTERDCWLTRKLNRFSSIQEAHETWRHKIHFWKQGKPGTVDIVAFNGVISVTEPEKMAQEITAGIGSAKAFGCGLITVSRIGGKR